jgi:hypothetical protein
MTAYRPGQWHDMFVAMAAVLNAWILLVEIHR